MSQAGHGAEMLVRENWTKEEFILTVGGRVAFVGLEANCRSKGRGRVWLVELYNKNVSILRLGLGFRAELCQLTHE